MQSSVRAQRWYHQRTASKLELVLTTKATVGAELCGLLLFHDVCRQVAEHARMCDGEVGVNNWAEQDEPVTISRALV